MLIWAKLTLGFAHNPAIQITQATRSNDAFAFTGLTSGTIGETTNGLNQLVNQAGVSLTYDARGNLTHDGTRGYSYDSENRLVSASDGARFFYDPMGRLNGTAAGSATAPELHYESLDDEVVAERSATGTTLRRFVHGPASDEPLVWYEGSGTAERKRRVSGVLSGGAGDREFHADPGKWCPGEDSNLHALASAST